ncbi:hypothetical protein Tco_0195664 [Tanacetum coccineum]
MCQEEHRELSSKWRFLKKFLPKFQSIKVYFSQTFSLFTTRWNMVKFVLALGMDNWFQLLGLGRLDVFGLLPLRKHVSFCTSAQLPPRRRNLRSIIETPLSGGDCFQFTLGLSNGEENRVDFDLVCHRWRSVTGFPWLKLVRLLARRIIDVISLELEDVCLSRSRALTYLYEQHREITPDGGSARTYFCQKWLCFGSVDLWTLLRIEVIRIGSNGYCGHEESSLSIVRELLVLEKSLQTQADLKFAARFQEQTIGPRILGGSLEQFCIVRLFSHRIFGRFNRFGASTKCACLCEGFYNKSSLFIFICASLEAISAIEMLWEWRGIANMTFIQLGGSSRVGEMILAMERSGFAGEKYGATYKL